MPYACLLCGNSDHIRATHKFRNTICRRCNIAPVSKKGELNALNVEENLFEESFFEEGEAYKVYAVNSLSRTEIFISVKTYLNLPLFYTVRYWLCFVSSLN